jgi:hypothetical protein
MRELYYIVGGLVLLILMIVVYISRKLENILLSGFWSANASFCQDADLQWFVMYLGDDTGYIRHIRNGYICAANDEGIIINNPVTIKFGPSMTFRPGMSQCKIYNISIEWDTEDLDIEDVFPSELQLAYYPKYGKIVMYKDDTVKAILWKDLQTTSVTTTEELIPKNIAKEKNGEDLEDNDLEDIIEEDDKITSKYEDL